MSDALALFADAIRPHRNWALAGFALALLSALAGLALLAGAGGALTGAAAGVGAWVVVRIVVLAVARPAARYAERLATHEATFGILKDLRVDMFRRLLPLAPAPLEDGRSGDLLQRVTADVDALDGLYLRILVPAGVAAVVALVLAVLLVGLDGILAIAVVALLALAGVGLPALADRLARGHGERKSERLAELKVTAVEGLQGLADLVASGAERRWRADLATIGGELAEIERLHGRIEGLGAGLGIALAQTALWLTAAVAGAAAAGGTAEPAMVGVAVFAVIAAFETVGPLPAASVHFGRARAAATRLAELTRLQPAVVDPAEAAPAPAAFDIALDRVAFGYGEAGPVLRDVSLTLAEGERILLIGPSGAGKTTLGELVLKLRPPRSGRIAIGGVPYDRLTQADIHARVGLLSQRSAILAGTIRENLLLGRPGATDEALWDALGTVGLADWLHSLPDVLDAWVGEHGAAMSGGEGRRLALARLVLKAPAVWILDEPTVGLDPRTEARLAGTLERVTRGRSVIAITHRPEALTGFDRIVELADGKLRPAEEAAT